MTLMLVLLLLSAVPPEMELLVTLNCPYLWSTPMSKKRSCFLSGHLGPSNLPGIIPTKRACSSAANSGHVQLVQVLPQAQWGISQEHLAPSSRKMKRWTCWMVPTEEKVIVIPIVTICIPLGVMGSLCCLNQRKRKRSNTLLGDLLHQFRLKAEYLGAHLSRYLCCLCSPCKCTSISNC